MWEFDNAKYFYLLLLLPVLAAIFVWNTLWKKKKIAEFGELHPTVAHKLHIKVPTCIAIIDDVSVLPNTPKYAKTPISEFQPITRDFAFVVESN